MRMRKRGLAVPRTAKDGLTWMSLPSLEFRSCRDKTLLKPRHAHVAKRADAREAMTEHLRLRRTCAATRTPSQVSGGACGPRPTRASAQQQLTTVLAQHPAPLNTTFRFACRRNNLSERLAVALLAQHRLHHFRRIDLRCSRCARNRVVRQPAARYQSTTQKMALRWAITIHR